MISSFVIDTLQHNSISYIGFCSNGGFSRVDYVLYNNQVVIMKIIDFMCSTAKLNHLIFENEVSMLKQCQTNYIVKFLAHLETNLFGMLFFKNYQQTSLLNFITTSPDFKLAKRMSVALQIIRGIQQLHQVGIVHGDVSASNIFVDKDGNAQYDIVVGDLGSATHEGQDQLTNYKSGYISPECSQENNTKSNKASDIHALGILLEGLFCGSFPEQGMVEVSEISDQNSASCHVSSNYSPVDYYRKLKVLELVNKMKSDIKLRPTIAEVIREFEAVYFEERKQASVCQEILQLKTLERRHMVSFQKSQVPDISFPMRYIYRLYYEIKQATKNGFILCDNEDQNKKSFCKIRQIDNQDQIDQVKILLSLQGNYALSYRNIFVLDKFLVEIVDISGYRSLSKILRDKVSFKKYYSGRWKAVMFIVCQLVCIQTNLSDQKIFIDGLHLDDFSIEVFTQTVKVHLSNRIKHFVNELDYIGSIKQLVTILKIVSAHAANCAARIQVFISALNQLHEQKKQILKLFQHPQIVQLLYQSDIEVGFTREVNGRLEFTLKPYNQAQQIYIYKQLVQQAEDIDDFEKQISGKQYILFEALE